MGELQASTADAVWIDESTADTRSKIEGARLMKEVMMMPTFISFRRDELFFSMNAANWCQGVEKPMGQEAVAVSWQSSVSLQPTRSS